MRGDRVAVVGGEHAGEGMSGTRDLTSGPVLPAGEQRERERGGAADRWGRAVRHGAARALLGCLGRGRRGAGSGRRRDLGQKRPSRGGEEKMFFLFLFLFLFLISIFYFYFLFIFFSFEQQFAK
jgi:hypothetical protein